MASKQRLVVWLAGRRQVGDVGERGWGPPRTGL